MPSIAPNTAQLAAFDRAAKLLFLLAGVSYYKTTVADKISCDVPIDAPTADFLREVYLKGLGEFAYRNELDLDARLQFPATTTDKPTPVKLDGRGALVPVGGGKDSIVSIEVLRAHGNEIALFALASSAAPGWANCRNHCGFGPCQACVAVRTLITRASSGKQRRGL